MSLLTLDLSLKSTGYALFDKEGNLLDNNKVCPPKDYTNPQKILFIITKLKEYYNQVSNLVIEDVYLGITGVRNLVSLSRLAGGVIYSWKVEHKPDAIFIGATHARPLVGLKGNCQKSEVQVFVLKKYKFVSPKLIYHYEVEIERLNEEKILIKQERATTDEEKKIKKKKLAKVKYQFNKLSKQIEKETGYGEDVCDSILLGNAYFKEKNGV